MGFNSSYVKVTIKAFINSLADEDYDIKLMKNEALYLSCIFDILLFTFRTNKWFNHSGLIGCLRLDKVFWCWEL